MTDEIANVDDSEYEDAFNEFSGGASPESIDEPEQVEDDAEQDGADVEPEVEASGTDEAEEAGSESESEAQEPDELAKLKEENQRLLHQFNSVNGRVSAFQRQTEELKQQLQQRQTQQPQAGDNPQGSGMSNEKWEALKKDYPDIAEAMEAQLNGIRSQYENQISSLKNEVEPLKQKNYETEQERMKAEARSALLERHPDFREIRESKEFNEWYERQPQFIRDYGNTYDVDKNAYIVDVFKATRAPQSPVENPVTSKRERQLKQAQTVPSRSTKGGQTEIADDDYEAAFNYYAEKK